MANQRQILTFEMDRLSANLAELRKEMAGPIAEKVLMAGASAYATSAQKHTPPNLGKSRIDAGFYTDGVMRRSMDRVPGKGIRPVFDLAAIVRSPSSKYRGFYGQKLREGYLYMVLVKRAGKRAKQIFCRNRAEAAKAAHETYRGITRAAWGLGFLTLRGKVPPAFRYLSDQRPSITRMAHLSRIRMMRENLTVTVTNEVITGGGYLSGTDVNASLAAVRTMNDMMEKELAKRRIL